MADAGASGLASGPERPAEADAGVGTGVAFVVSGSAERAADFAAGEEAFGAEPPALGAAGEAERAVGGFGAGFEAALADGFAVVFAVGLGPAVAAVLGAAFGAAFGFGCAFAGGFACAFGGGFGRLAVAFADLAAAAAEGFGATFFGAAFFGAFGLIATSGRSFGREA